MRRRSRSSAAGVVLATLFLAVAVGPAASADPGQFDPSWSGDGQAFIQVSATADADLNAAVLQPDGRLILVGRDNTGGPRSGDFALVRLKPDGYPDLSFGGDGRVMTDAGDDSLRDVALQPGGRIVAAGGTDQTGFTLLRYTSSGALDPTFSGDGRVVIPSLSSARGVAIQPDGRIVAVADTSNAIVVLRFRANGTLDPTFDHDGMRTLSFPGQQFSGAQDVGLDSAGRIVVLGDGGTLSEHDWDVARLKPSGAFDRTFSGDGRVNVDFSPFDQAVALAIRPDDRIVIGGTVQVSHTDSELALARLTSTGAIDTTFGGDGRVTSNPSAGFDFLNAIALQGPKVLLTGQVETSTTDRLIVVDRLRADGTPDPTFAGTGQLQLNPTTGADSGNAVVVGGGRILVCGEANDGSSRLYYVAGLLA